MEKESPWELECNLISRIDMAASSRRRNDSFTLEELHLVRNKIDENLDWRKTRCGDETGKMGWPSVCIDGGQIGELWKGRGCMNGAYGGLYEKIDII